MNAMLMEHIDALFKPWNHAGTPGCALGIIHNGDLVYRRGYGEAVLEHEIPISPTSSFYVCSLSKQFTAACIAMLSLQGKISLQANIRDYIPELPDYGESIQIEHLIHHTSGLPDYIFLAQLTNRFEYMSEEQDVLRLVKPLKQLNFRPGERYSYSNTGYFLLALLIKRITGWSLREYAYRNLFLPAGMLRSGFNDRFSSLIPGRVTGYYQLDDGSFGPRLTTYHGVGDGGLMTCIDDLAKWDQFFYHDSVNVPHLLDLMLTRGVLNNGEKIPYAFGLRRGEYHGLNTIDHSGGFPGFRGEYLHFPDQQISIICLANLENINATELTYRVADLYLQAELRGRDSIPGIRGAGHFAQGSKFLPETYDGVYWSEENHCFCLISTVEGRMTANLSGWKFNLASIDSTHFIGLYTDSAVQIDFCSADDQTTLIVYMDERLLGPFLKVEPHPLETDKGFLDYQGTFTCRELGVDAQVESDQGTLYLWLGTSQKSALKNIIKEVYFTSDLTIRFQRDAQGIIRSFSIGNLFMGEVTFQSSTPSFPENRVALITGAGSGIGTAIACTLARRGILVVVNDREEKLAEAVATSINREGGRAVARSADVSDESQIRALIEDILKEFGAIHILVNNAGLLRPTSPLEFIPCPEWDLVMAVNVRGAYLCTKYVLPQMKIQRYGKIINVSSSAGRTTSTFGGAHYTASKAAVLGLTRHTARESAPFNINVNAIDPGSIDTNMVHSTASQEALQNAVDNNPFKRLGTVQEVANLVAFLVSDEAAYITGATVDINGGDLMI